MNHNCGACGKRLNEFSFHRRRWFNFGKLRFILRNSWSVQCQQCLRYNFLLDKDDLARIEDSLVMELVGWPEVFSGIQFSWISNYIVERAPQNELLALWLDWDGFGGQKKTDSQEVIDCLMRRVGCKNIAHFKKMKEAEKISKEADEVLRSIMKMIFVPDGFPVKTYFDKENGGYFLAVNLATLTKKQERKDDDLEWQAKWRKVNKLLTSLKQPSLSSEAFKFFLKDSKGVVFCCYGDGQQEVLIVVFAYFHREDKFVYASRLAMKADGKLKKELLSALFLRLIIYAREKRAERVILEKPLQEEVYCEALRFGFKHKSSKLLEFHLVYVS